MHEFEHSEHAFRGAGATEGNLYWAEKSQGPRIHRVRNGRVEVHYQEVNFCSCDHSSQTLLHRIIRYLVTTPPMHESLAT